AERHFRVLGLPSAEDRQVHRFARLRLVDEVDDFVHPGDLLAVHFGDDVAAEGDFGAADRRLGAAAFDPGLVGGPALDHRLDDHAFCDRQVDRLREVGGDRAAFDPEVGVFDFALGLELVDLGAGGVDRDREADADVAVAAATGLDLGVDPDHLAFGVDQRAA